ACARGRADAQRRTYELLYPYAMSIALHYAGYREEAEEITQDAFVRFFRQLLRKAPEGTIRAYFGRIVVNGAIDLLRKRKRRPYTEEITAAHDPALGCDRNTGTDRLEEEEIYRLLQLLPPSYRLVFNLHVLEGYTHPEIAARLSISEGTSKSQLFKARRRLRQLATQYYQLNQSTES
ncbi:MAG: RNA polymerase sigma factor, partial [Bacteroidota bacterium]